MTPPIRFQGVEHESQHGGAVSRWTFEVSEGSFTAAAASTSIADEVIRLCIGSRAPSQGSVSVLGTEPRRLSRTAALAFRRRLGVCFRREGLVSTASLRENLLLPMIYARSIAGPEAHERVERAIQELDLAPWADRRPSDLPRELRLVAALARAACPEPELMILETAAVGARDARATEALVWCRSRSPTIFVLHPHREHPISELADRWVTLSQSFEAPEYDPPGAE